MGNWSLGSPSGSAQPGPKLIGHAPVTVTAQWLEQGGSSMDSPTLVPALTREPVRRKHRHFQSLSVLRIDGILKSVCDDTLLDKCIQFSIIH